jgi:hypothetical protein
MAAVGLGLAACAVAPAPQSASAGCARCHETAKFLPPKHPAVPEGGIAACVACHPPKPDTTDPNPFAARMHRAHTRVGVECAACHGLQPDGSFTLLEVPGRLATLDIEDLGRVKKAMESWGTSDYLDADHGAKRNLMCGACHLGQLIPDDNETTLNRQCTACHGTNAQVSAKLKARLKNPHIDPHASHLGEIACTACHQGHQASKAYCLGCHTNFVMPIPGGAKS